MNVYLFNTWLPKIFNFSTSDLHWYTNTTSYWSWLVIDTTNQRCVSWWNSWWYTHWNWMIYHEINAKKYWCRWKIKFLSLANKCWIWIWWPFWWYSMDTYYVTAEWYSKNLKLMHESTTLKSTTYNFSAWTYYYLDIKFENWVFTVNLYDEWLSTVLATLSHTDNTITSIKSSWFNWWASSSNPNWIEIKEYYEAVNRTEENSNIYYENELKNAYIGEVLVLKQFFDFSTNDWKWFSMVATMWNWLKIDTTNKYCTWNPSSSAAGNGEVYKIINANKYHWRIKFMFTYARWWCWVWPFYNSDLNDCTSNMVAYSNNQWHLYIGRNGSTVVDNTVSISLNQYYYLDLKFENWLYTAILLDSNLNEIKTITYQTSDTSIKYNGFAWWWQSSTLASWWIIKEYREAYK